MPGYIMDDNRCTGDGKNAVKSILEEVSSENKSGMSPCTRSAQNDIPPLEEAPAYTSIERLYENIYEMQSSENGSPSRISYDSEARESRIDSELGHLVGRGKGEEEAREEKGSRQQILIENMASKEEPKLAKQKSSRTEVTEVSVSRRRYSKNSRKKSPVRLQRSSSARSRSSKLASDIPVNMIKQNGRDLDRTNTIPAKKNASLRQGALPICNGAETAIVPELENPDLGRFLLNHARDLISSGDNHGRALTAALRAAKSFELCGDPKPSLELTMTLHTIAAIYCKLGQYSMAIPFLQQSIKIPVVEEGNSHALAKFAGYMQLGDTYALQGELGKSIDCYTTGLEIQKEVLGDTDASVGETCRYLAEAHVQALNLNEAQRLCQVALDIHREINSTTSFEEASDRRLMGLICYMKGDYEAALQHLIHASMSMAGRGKEKDMASVDCSIGDTYLSLARYEEAAFAYQKALTVLKSTNGEDHLSVASVLVHLADLYNKTGKIRESRSYCESALRIYKKPDPGASKEEIAGGLAELSSLYESMNEPEQALKLLHKALKVYGNAPGQQRAAAAVEAQIGVMHYMKCNYSDSCTSFKSSIAKLRASGERSAFFGIVLNQMGLVCVQLHAMTEASNYFKEARNVIEEEYGPYHPETLGVCSNLAGAYDAMGRINEAIEILDNVVEIREEKLGTANPDVDDERSRLAQLLKEAGRVRNRQPKSLETLLDTTTLPAVRFV